LDKTLINVVEDIVKEVQGNDSINRERVYISRELFEDLRLELERYKKQEEDMADRFLHSRRFSPGREPNNF
jgi:hypothetical protein